MRIQGSEVRHVAVFQDGVPLNQLANPLTDLAHIPVEGIERIEIYKGTASAAWGSALGGVVNIVTRQAESGKPVNITGGFSMGEFGTTGLESTVNGVKGGVGYLLSVAHQESDGFISHTDYSKTSFYSSFHADFGDASRLRFIYSNNTGQSADPVLDYPEFWDDSEQQRVYQQMQFDTSPNDRLHISLQGHHHQFENKIEDVFEDHREIFNDYSEDLWGAGALVKWTPDGKHSLVGGFDGNWGEYDWIYYSETFNTGTWALFANDTIALNRLSLNAGLRYDHDDNFGGEVSPSLGAVFRFEKYQGMVRAQVSRGFSAPPAAWIYDPTYGNPDLSSETAVNYQLGAEMHPLEWLLVKADLFRADVDNLLNFDLDAMHWRNIDKVRRQGVETKIRATFDSGLSLSMGADWVDIRDETTGDTVRNIPRKTYHSTISFVKAGTSQTLFGRFIDQNSSYPETRDRLFVFDYALRIQPAKFINYGRPTFFLNIYNIFDAGYLYRTIWPQPGRWVEGGLRFSL